MSPTSIGPVKAMLLGLDIGQLSEVLMAALDDDTPGVSVRDLLLRHAEEHNIPV
jgi:phosphotransferase system enzyme I (PtsP)